MVQVTRKHENEANENLIRRFNRKVLPSVAKKQLLGVKEKQKN